MTQPSDADRRLLSAAEVRADLPGGWVQAPRALHARFNTGGFVAGAEFVQRMVALAEAADHHPDVHLTWPWVEVAIGSHDVAGITARDLRLAAQVSALAEELGHEHDPGAVSVVEWALDVDPGQPAPAEAAADAPALAAFHAALTGGQISRGEVAPGGPNSPLVWFQERDPDNPGDAQRWHPDVWVAPSAVAGRLAAVRAAGGTILSDADAPAFWVVADAEGNRACLCTGEGR